MRPYNPRRARRGAWARLVFAIVLLLLHVWWLIVPGSLVINLVGTGFAIAAIYASAMSLHHVRRFRETQRELWRSLMN